MSTEGPQLSAIDIYKRYPSKSGTKDDLAVLSGVSISIPDSTIIAIHGPSGCGKSTLLHILGGLDRPTSGHVFWDKKDISMMNDIELARFRNQTLGFVFQFHHLLPEFTALENVFIPALVAGGEKNEIETRAENLLTRFGLGERIGHRPSELSGGEQQRVAVARALMNKPQFILADEPTGNLDDHNTEVMLDLLFRLRDEEGVSIVLVTHDEDIVRRADMIYELGHGELVLRKGNSSKS